MPGWHKTGCGPSPSDADLDAAAAAAWTEEHEKEALMQMKVKAKLQRAIVQQGVLPQETLGPGAEQQMAAYRAVEEQREKTWRVKDARLRKIHAPPQAIDIKGRRTLADGDVRQVIEKTLEQRKLVLHRNDSHVVEDRIHASLFVTHTPSEPGDGSAVLPP